MVQSVFWIIVTMGIVPLILGMPWLKNYNPKHQYSYVYSTGFFIELALFQVVSVPVTLTMGHFKTIIVIYSIALCVVCMLSMWNLIRVRSLKRLVNHHLSWIEVIYIIAFICILCVQIIRGTTYDITYMSYDDAIYTVISSDAFVENGVLDINFFTGESMGIITKYALASWNLFPAFFSIVSGISVATIAHTVQYIQLIILAYSIYWFVAGEIIKKRENQLIFMLIIALFYWFGYHSHYSLTFRLLGPNYQGKAVLAVSLTPYLLMILIKKLEERYTIGSGILLFVLSVAGISFTLWSTGTIIVIITVPVLLSLFRKERNWKHLFYLLWGNIVPVLGFCYFLLNKFGV